MKMKFFSLIVLFLLVISIDSKPGKRRIALKVASDESEVEVKKKCTKPVEHVTKKPQIKTTTPKPRKCKPKTTTVEPEYVEEPEVVTKPVKKPCKKKTTTPAPVTKKPCFSKIIKKCEKVNVGTKKSSKYRTRCRKVKMNFKTKAETPITDWEYVDEDPESNYHGEDSTKDKSDLDNDVGEKNGGFIKVESTPDSTEKNSEDGKDKKQCKKFNVGTKKQPKYRKKCRKVKVDSVTKKTTVIGDWEYEDDEDNKPESSGEIEKDPGLEKSEEGVDSDGTKKQCKNFNVGTKKLPKYRKKCRKVKVDSVTKKTTVVGDWEYDNGDDDGEENQSSASKPKSSTGSDGANGDEDYKSTEDRDNKKENQSLSTEATDGKAKPHGTKKECKNFNVGTKKQPKYRKKCRKVKVDSVTKKTTVVGDWQYDNDDDDDGDEGASKPKSSSGSDGANGDEEYDATDDEDNKPESQSSSTKATSGNAPKPDKTKKECKNFNVGTKKLPKYRKKCRKVKVDSVTKKATVVEDWEYEDGDDNNDEDENQNQESTTSSASKPKMGGSEVNVDGQSGSDGTKKECKNFNVGTKKLPKYRKKCRKVKVDSATKKTTVVGDWEYENGDDDGEEKQSSASKPKSGSVEVYEDGSEGAENQTSNTDGSQETDDITKECKNFNVGTKKIPKYRKKCQKVKVDSVTKKTTVIGDWEYGNDDSDEDQHSTTTTTRPKSSSVEVEDPLIYQSRENVDGDGTQKQCKNFNVGTKKHPEYKRKCRKVKVDSVTKKTTVLGDWEYDNDDEQKSSPGTPSSSSTATGNVDYQEGSDEIQKQCEKIIEPRLKSPNVIYTQRCRKIKVNSVTKKTTVISDWEYEDDLPESTDSEEVFDSQPRTHTDTETHGKSNVKQECEEVNIGTKAHPKIRKRCRDVETTKITERNTTTTEWDEKGERKVKHQTKFVRKSRVDDDEDRDDVEYEDDQYLSKDSHKVVRKLAYGTENRSQDMYYEVQGDKNADTEYYSNENVSNVRKNSENRVEYETEDDQYYEEGDNFRKLTRKSASTHTNQAKSLLRSEPQRDFNPPIDMIDLYYGDD